MNSNKILQELNRNKDAKTYLFVFIAAVAYGQYKWLKMAKNSNYAVVKWSFEMVFRAAYILRPLLIILVWRSKMTNIEKFCVIGTLLVSAKDDIYQYTRI